MIVAGGAIAAVGYVISKNQSGASARLNGSQSLNYQIFTIQPYLTGEGAVTEISVRDLHRGAYYYWSNGTWNTPPQCYVGTSTLMIEFTAVNNGNSAATLTLKLSISSTVVKTVTASNVPVGGTATLSYTGDMGSTAINCLADVSP